MKQGDFPSYSSSARERRGVLTALALVWTGWSFPADLLRTIHLRVLCAATVSSALKKKYLTTLLYIFK